MWEITFLLFELRGLWDFIKAALADKHGGPPNRCAQWGSYWTGNQAKTFRDEAPRGRLGLLDLATCWPRSVCSGPSSTEEKHSGLALNPAMGNKTHWRPTHIQSPFSVYTVPDSGSTQERMKLLFEAFVWSVSHLIMSLPPLHSHRPTQVLVTNSPFQPLQCVSLSPAPQSSSTCLPAPSTQCETEHLFPEGFPTASGTHTFLTLWILGFPKWGTPNCVDGPPCTHVMSHTRVRYKNIVWIKRRTENGILWNVLDSCCVFNAKALPLSGWFKELLLE